MNVQAKDFFTILEKKSDTVFRIQENVPESVEQQIEIVFSTPAKDQEGRLAMIYKTTEGRQFARLDKWPEDLLLEVRHQN